MKKILALTLGLLVLAGCSTVEAPSVKTTENISASQQASINVADQKLNSSTIDQLSISALDQVAYDGARQLNDKSYCEKISDAATKQKCLDDLSGKNTTSESISTDCSKLTADTKSACELQLQIDAKVAENNANKQKEIDSQAKLTSEYIKAGDIAKCKSLTLPASNLECEMNILVPKAIAAKDDSVCEQASNKEIVEACKTGAVFK